MNRYDLPNILYKAIKDMGGKTNIIDVCKLVWKSYQNDLENSGDLFYTWQYDIRWAATELRKTKRMKAAEQSPRGIWEIV
ncbi:hypothetical protein V6615_04790 [Oscillospiraceae bacterium PP1C4]